MEVGSGFAGAGVCASAGPANAIHNMEASMEPGMDPNTELPSPLLRDTLLIRSSLLLWRLNLVLFDSPGKHPTAIPAATAEQHVYNPGKRFLIQSPFRLEQKASRFEHRD
jgi:hypothetical protein